MIVWFKLAGRLVKGRITQYYFWGRTWHCLVEPIGGSFKVTKWIVLADVQQFDWSQKVEAA